MKKTLMNRISGLSFLIAIAALAISVMLMITGCSSAEELAVFETEKVNFVVNTPREAAVPSGYTTIIDDMQARDEIAKAFGDRSQEEVIAYAQ